MRTKGILIAAAIAVLATSSAHAQDAANGDKKDEIVVEGQLLKPGKLPTEQRAATGNGVKHRIIYENSLAIAKCAMRLPTARLKKSIDDAPNKASQREAQAWLVRLTASCNADPAVTSQYTPGGTTPTTANIGTLNHTSITSALVANGVAESNQERSAGGRSVYDYGAFLETAIKRFAPDIKLTRRETNDPAVQARFNALEVPRNRYRLAEDYEYFEVAVCMVRMEPQLSTRLFNAKPGSDLQRLLQANIINNARVCVGNAKRVSVDPTQFRIYIIDALHRWVLASRGVTSLIPDEDS